MVILNHRRWIVFICFGAIYIIWGSTYYGIRVAVETIPPFSMCAARCLIAGLLLYCAAYVIKSQKPTKVHVISSAKVGFTLLFLGMGLISWSEQRIPSAYAALIFASVPAWMAVIDWIIFKTPRPPILVIAGIAVGILSVTWLLGSQLHTLPKADWKFLLALGFACIAWSFGSVQMKHLPLPKSPVMSTALEMLFGGLCLLVGAFATHEDVRITVLSRHSICALAYLILFGSLASYCAYGWLLRHVPATAVSTYAFVNPIVAVVPGGTLGSERISSQMIGAGGGVLIGVMLIVFSPRIPGRESRETGMTSPLPAVE